MDLQQIGTSSSYLHGAIVQENGTAKWSVWAPWAETVELVLFEGKRQSHFPMRAEDDGFHRHHGHGVAEGRHYAYRLDGGPLLPRPASRWLPLGVPRPSALFAPGQFPWTDAEWQGVRRDELVIYELHVGTFTARGTFEAIIPRLPILRELGVTAIELMPVAQFPGG